MDRWRVILHLDLDAFYCQVEHKRLGIDRNVPLAVQQWAGLIAVNYPARANGVGRFCDINEAKTACPNLKLVHVETIGNTKGGKVGAVEANKGTSKASLARYRRASFEVINVMKRFSDKIERASIDEVYIDVTALVDDRLRRSGDFSDGGGLEWSESHVAEGAALNPSSEHDIRLIMGAKVCKEIRDAIKAETEYEMSAGISHNKLLSKLASAMNKPNKQTIVPASAVPSLMSTLEYKQINGLGGKLGDRLVQLFPGLKTALDLQGVPREDLVRGLGEKTAGWLQQLCRGDCDSDVKPNLLPKSLNACKSFPASELGAVKKWLLILAEELSDRILEDHEDFGRTPRLLVLHARSSKTYEQHSSQGPMPAKWAKERLFEHAMRLFEKIQGECLPCSRLALGAAGFVAEERNMKKLETFFSAAGEAEEARPAGRRAAIGTAGGEAPSREAGGGKRSRALDAWVERAAPAEAGPAEGESTIEGAPGEAEWSVDRATLQEINRQRYLLDMISKGKGTGGGVGAPGGAAKRKKPAAGQSSLSNFFTRRPASSHVSRCCPELPEDYLALDDDRLWEQCQMETFRASGPGGQHRNKVESAVRVTHRPTGVLATATERRSQHENRRNALERLRSKIALQVRRRTELDPNADFEVPPELAAILPTRKKSMRYGQKHREYPRGVQVLVDLLVSNNLSVADTARQLGLSTGALSRLITADNDLLSEINRMRQSKGMRPLRK